MKLTIISLFFLPLQLSAQIKVDARGNKIHGNVKMIVERCHSLENDGIRTNASDETNIYTYYDNLNQVILIKGSKDDTLIGVYKEVFQYNEDRLTKHYKIENKRYRLSPNDSISSTATYHYDRNKRLIEERHAVSTIKWKIKYRYDSKGNKTESEETRGDPITVNDHTSDGKTIEKYDKEGYTTQRNTYDNDSLFRQTTYTYDSAHRHLVMYSGNVGNPDATIEKSISRFDNRMNLIEETSYTKFHKTNGEFKKSGAHINCEYIYDTAGNWVEHTLYMHEKKLYIKTRAITYN